MCVYVHNETFNIAKCSGTTDVYEESFLPYIIGGSSKSTVTNVPRDPIAFVDRGGGGGGGGGQLTDQNGNHWCL